MTKNTEETQCETTQDTQYTKVATGYGRACIILLALNFCLTGYVLSSLMDIQTIQAGTQTQVTPTQTTGSKVALTDQEAKEALENLEKEVNTINGTTVPILPADE